MIVVYYDCVSISSLSFIINPLFQFEIEFRQTEAETKGFLAGVHYGSTFQM